MKIITNYWIFYNHWYFFMFCGMKFHVMFYISYTKGMKKNFLFTMLAVLFALFWFGGVSLAYDVAQIGNTWYETLSNAISGAQAGDVIKLLWDTTEISFYVAANKDFILDLNWYTLTLKNTTSSCAWDLVDGTCYDYIYGNLTIKDSATNGKVVVNDAWMMPRTWGTLTIENWIFDTQTNYKDYMFYLWWGTLHIIDWTFNGYYNIVNCYADWDLALGWTVIIDSWYFITNENDGWNTTIMWYENSDITINWWTFIMNATDWEYVFYIWEGTLNGWVSANNAIATIKWWEFIWPVSAEDGAKLSIEWWVFSIEPDASYIKSWYYAKERDDSKYEITQIQEITTIEISWVTSPMSWANPTIEGLTITEWLTITNTEESKPQWKDWDTVLSGSDIFESSKSYTLVVPFTVDTWYVLASSPTASGNDNPTNADVTVSWVILTYYVASWYTVTFNTNGGNNIESQEITIWNKAEKPADPTKDGFTFKGWYSDEALTTEYDFASDVSSDITLYAKWEKVNSSNSSTSWWGGWSWKGTSSRTDNDKSTDTDKKSDDTQNTNTELENYNADKDTPEVVNYNPDLPADQQTLSDGLTPEMHEAYEFAKENWITTMPTILDADMYGPLDRIAMAKMLSNYATNVLGKTPDTTREVPNFPDINEQLDAEYWNAVTLAYQLGIMWINIDEFRPFDIVTRAEFATALSRMLYGIADGIELYYEPHMQKLLEEKIITVADPDMLELRGYVMIMLMRSAKK